MKTFIDFLDAGFIELDLLTGEDVQAIRGCFVSRGKRKGLLKLAAPPHDSGLRAAFDGLMCNVAPARIGVFARMMSAEQDQAQFDRIERAFDSKIHPNNFHLLNATGQRPNEFNLFACAFDVDVVAQILGECK